MESPGKPLEHLLALARGAKPAGGVKPEDIHSFAQRTASAWQRERAIRDPSDSLRSWERVGNWSVACAAAAVVMILILRSNPAPTPNPFDAFGPMAIEEVNLF